MCWLTHSLAPVASWSSPSQPHLLARIHWYSFPASSYYPQRGNSIIVHLSIPASQKVTLLLCLQQGSQKCGLHFITRALCLLTRMNWHYRRSRDATAWGVSLLHTPQSLSKAFLFPPLTNWSFKLQETTLKDSGLTLKQALLYKDCNKLTAFHFSFDDRSCLIYAITFCFRW